MLLLGAVRVAAGVVLLLLRAVSMYVHMHNLALLGHLVWSIYLQGTTFVDSLANVLSTRTLTAELHLTPAEGVQFQGDTPSGKSARNCK